MPGIAHDGWWPRFMLIAALTALSLTLSACSSEPDPTPDYRYRLTVEVETPEGLRSGSSVIEVTQNLGRARGSPANSAIYRRVRGEAVAVDLPGGQTLFALLRSNDSVDWAGSVMESVAPKTDGEPFEERFDNVLLVEGEVELPQQWPKLPTGDQFSAYPMLVTFGNLDDPASVSRVDPNDLIASFGERYALRRITVQLTDEAVNTGIEQRLRWLAGPLPKHLTTSDFPEGFPVGGFSRLFRQE